jgi:hypothetical protein
MPGMLSEHHWARKLSTATEHNLPLTLSDSNELEEFYRVSYPGNWFEPYTLETGCYYGIRHGASLISVAGVHVYSQHYKVAALGNQYLSVKARIKLKNVIWDSDWANADQRILIDFASHWVKPCV